MTGRSVDKAGEAASAFCDALFTARQPSLHLGARPGARDAAWTRAEAAARGLPASAPDAARRNRVLEGLALLWHDHADAAHEIAQSREGERDHDLLHAIFHRREGDHGNADYWFSGAGKHPCYPILAQRLSVLPLAPALRAGLLPEGAWSPAAFNAEVRRKAREEGPAAETLSMIQAEEFRAFAYALFRAP